MMRMATIAATLLVCGAAQAQTYYPTMPATLAGPPMPKTALEDAWNICRKHAFQHWDNDIQSYDWTLSPDFQKPCEQIEVLWNKRADKLNAELYRKRKESEAKQNKADLLIIEHGLQNPDGKPCDIDGRCQ